MKQDLKLELRLQLSKNRQMSDVEMPLYYERTLNPNNNQYEEVCIYCKPARVVPRIMSYVHVFIKHKDKLQEQ